MSYPFYSKVLAHECIASGFFKLTLASPPGLTRPVAGQFVHIHIADRYIPLLRRPFSLYDASPSRFTIVYKVVGKGTKELSRVVPGEELDVLGPLGNGFSVSNTTAKHILVGGGVGIAPLAFLANTLASQPDRAVGSVQVIAGFRCVDDVVCVDVLHERPGIFLTVQTEDGTQGEPGLAHTALGDLLEANHEDPCAVYACGPRPMLREVARIGEKYHVPTQVLMEETIACGLGACQGCVVRGTDGYLRVCTDGPVFDASCIDWSDAP